MRTILLICCFAIFVSCKKKETPPPAALAPVVYCETDLTVTNTITISYFMERADFYSNNDFTGIHVKFDGRRCVKPGVDFIIKDQAVSRNYNYINKTRDSLMIRFNNYTGRIKITVTDTFSTGYKTITLINDSVVAKTETVYYRIPS